VLLSPPSPTLATRTTILSWWKIQSWVRSTATIGSTCPPIGQGRTTSLCHCYLISMGGQGMLWGMKAMGITFTRLLTKTWTEVFFCSLQKEQGLSMEVSTDGEVGTFQRLKVHLEMFVKLTGNTGGRSPAMTPVSSATQ